MKSDVIRKRARHDARRASGHSSETPSASPGASRRASPEGNTPTLAPDSTTQSSFSGDENSDYRAPTQAEIINAFANIPQSQQNGSQMHNSSDSFSSLSYALSYSGPYQHDQVAQMFNMADGFSFSQDGSDYDLGGDGRASKRRRMSNDSGSEPPSSAYSGYSSDSYSNGVSSATSATSHSQRSSLDAYGFSFPNFGSLFRSPGSGNSMHPPMLPPDNSPQFNHQQVLQQDDSSMDYLQNMQHDDTADALFNTYLHPPMLPPEDSPKVSLGSLLPHPPMVPHEWSAASAYELHDNAMQVY